MYKCSVCCMRTTRLCKKSWKVWHCPAANVWTRMETLDEHKRGSAECGGTRRPLITTAMKQYIKDVDETVLSPRHIWSGLRCSGLQSIYGEPSYAQIVRCVE